MKRYSQKPQLEEPTVNLTPLIDVVFVILIMFIVVAPLLELDRIELAQAPEDPKSGAISVQEGGPVAIHVHQDNTVWFNKQMVTLEQLGQLLKNAMAHYPTARPQLFQDKRAQFGIYQTIKNACETAGFEELDIILKPA